jgi:hypothetical protein
MTRSEFFDNFDFVELGLMAMADPMLVERLLTPPAPPAPMELLQDICALESR